MTKILPVPGADMKSSLTPRGPGTTLSFPGLCSTVPLPHLLPMESGGQALPGFCRPSQPFPSLEQASVLTGLWHEESLTTVGWGFSG